ncbi:MAG: hypothetical protein HKO66_13690, partial [Saprospiraceae bacterium]|nr:hypothetical protein [Bacteroidia bacterium]NNL93287.1 hypothetical protein [Saprospiraceae bacterium]
MGNSDDPTPEAGTIRWTGTDFEGFDGTSWVSFTTTQDSRLVDIDNNKYETVTIGTQIWMAENLRVTRFNDGTPIPIVTDNADWLNTTTPAMTWFFNGEWGTDDA